MEQAKHSEMSGWFDFVVCLVAPNKPEKCRLISSADTVVTLLTVTLCGAQQQA
jgi:hypothetical protein